LSASLYDEVSPQLHRFARNPAAFVLGRATLPP
jgi:hypothetical protein